MTEEILDKKGAIRAISIATVLALVGIAIVGWAYYQRLPALEQAVEE